MDIKSNMKDVAKLAGVSLGTVSNVINKNPCVKEGNRAKVLAAMERLDFVPNFAAKQLRSSRSGVVGLLLPVLTNPYYMAIAYGVSEEAALCGNRILLCSTNRNAEEEATLLEELIARQAAGIIIAKPALSADRLKDYARKVHIVLLDQPAGNPLDLDTVQTDNHRAMMDAVEYLYGLGHTKIAFLGGDLSSASAAERLRGFRDGMARKKLPVPKGYESCENYSLESGYQRALGLIGLECPPTAMICGNELLALGVYRAAEELGLHIPEDLSVVGCDNTLLADVVTPKLTTIDQQMLRQSTMAMDLLNQRLTESEADGFAPCRRCVIEAPIRLHDSCQAVPQGK